MGTQSCIVAGSLGDVNTRLSPGRPTLLNLSSNMDLKSGGGGQAGVDTNVQTIAHTITTQNKNQSLHHNPQPSTSGPAPGPCLLLSSRLTLCLHWPCCRLALKCYASTPGPLNLLISLLGMFFPEISALSTLSGVCSNTRPSLTTPVKSAARSPALPVSLACLMFLCKIYSIIYVITFVLRASPHETPEDRDFFLSFFVHCYLPSAKNSVRHIIFVE